MDHNSVYSKDRSTTRGDREGRADDPSAGVSNNNLKDITSSCPPTQKNENTLQASEHVTLPCTVLVPPKIQLSTEEDVKDISEDTGSLQEGVGKGIFCQICLLFIFGIKVLSN